MGGVDYKMFTVVAISLMHAGVLIGFFLTKTDGFGKFTTATLLFVIVLYTASLAFFLGLVEGASFMNVLAAVVGFAGGLFAARDA